MSLKFPFKSCKTLRFSVGPKTEKDLFPKVSREKRGAVSNEVSRERSVLLCVLLCSGFMSFATVTRIASHVYVILLAVYSGVGQKTAVQHLALHVPGPSQDLQSPLLILAADIFITFYRSGHTYTGGLSPSSIITQQVKTTQNKNITNEHNRHRHH